VYTHLQIKAKTLEIPLSCRFFILGEPQNKTAAKSPFPRGTLKAPLERGLGDLDLRINSNRLMYTRQVNLVGAIHELPLLDLRQTTNSVLT
jgi:hypothetical protein